MINSNIKIITYYVLGFCCIVLLWFIGQELHPQKVPSIKTVINLLLNGSCTNDGTNKNLLRLILTGERAFWGLILSWTISFFIVLIVSLIPNFDFIIKPLAVFFKTTPVVALVPIFMMFFKSSGCYIASSVAISFFPLYIGGINGLQSVPHKTLRLAKIYNTNSWNQFIYFKHGYVLKGMIGALQISAPLSVVGAIVGEYVIGGNDYSLGIFIASNTGASDYEARFVAIMLSFFAGMIFYIGSFIINKWYGKHIRIETS